MNKKSLLKEGFLVALLLLSNDFLAKNPGGCPHGPT